MIFCPSVTEVLSVWSDFSAINPAVLQAAADRGTAVHAHCTAMSQGLMIIGANPDHQGYLNSFQAWLDRFLNSNGRVLWCELRLVDPAYHYHGQPDLLVTDCDGRNLLIDLKTPVAHQKSWALQLAAYRRLVEANGHSVSACGSLRLHPEGRVPKMDWYQHSTDDFHLFLQCLNLYRFFKGGN